MKNITIKGFNLPINIKIIDPAIKNHKPSSRLSIVKLLFVAMYEILLSFNNFLHA
jgi:hypothetical protein